MLPCRTLALLALLLFYACLNLPAQRHYLWPLPQSHALTGNFGELRGTTFHPGIDIRTFEKTGLPILAAEDGFVWRVFVAFYGYGKAIYIRHKDGNSTAYAHVERFMPAVEEYVYDLQLKQKAFDLQVFPEEKLFPVHRGDTIAWSGNNGASEGPHLHYEVRNPAEEILNPLLYHSGDTNDELPPYLSGIALEPIDTNSRIQGRWEKFFFKPEFSERLYYYSPIVEVEGRVGLEFIGYDRLNGAVNWNGIYSTRLMLDDSVLFGWKFNRFAFDQGRNLLQHVDWNFNRSYFTNLQKCYLDAHNQLPIYEPWPAKGYILLQDTLVHTLRLSVYDFQGNEARFTGKLRRARKQSAVVYDTAAAATLQPKFEVHRQVLVLRGTVPTSPATAAVTVRYANGNRRNFYPSYRYEDAAVTLVPLTAGALPVAASAATWPDSLSFPFQLLLLPEAAGTVKAGESFQADLPAGAAFEPIPVGVSLQNLASPEVLSPLYALGDYHYPLAKAYTLRLSLDYEITGLQLDQIGIAQQVGDNKWLGISYGKRIGRNYYGQVYSFGNFCLIRDSLKPEIKPANFQPGGRMPAKGFLQFSVTDDLSGIHPGKVALSWDGQWALPEYYNYQNVLYYRPRTKPARGRHTATITLTDYAGNSTTRSFTVVEP